MRGKTAFPFCIIFAPSAPSHFTPHHPAAALNTFGKQTSSKPFYLINTLIKFSSSYLVYCCFISPLPLLPKPHQKDSHQIIITMQEYPNNVNLKR